MMDHADIVIAGGGPVGGALALALKDGGRSVTVLEARGDFSRQRDPRALALSYGGMLILRRLGIWDRLPAPTPITAIHVSRKGGLGRCLLSADADGLPALGYVADYDVLDRALREALAGGGVHYLTGAAVTRTRTASGYAVVDFLQHGAARQLTTRLLARADGGRGDDAVPGSGQQVRDYGQSAVVAPVRSELPHRNVAYERFTGEGPLALLPSGDGLALVWTCAPERARRLCAMAEPDFLAALHGHFGDRLGRFTAAGPRAAFPLVLKYARPVVAQRTVLLGNAAQTLHPVAGQGFNLGLRDAWELAAEILATPPGEIGGRAMLERYRAGRRLDSAGSILFTDTLARLFSNDDPILRHGLGLGLMALEGLLPAKRFVARRMMFGARGCRWRAPTSM